MPQEFPDENEYREKDYIIARCPLLRTFLDEFDDGIYETWLKNLRLESVKAFENIEELMGEDKVDDNVGIIVSEASDHRVFNDKLNEDNKEFFSKVIVSMGFELDNDREAEIIWGDVFERLCEAYIVVNTMDAATFTRHAVFFGLGCKNEGREIFEDVIPSPETNVENREKILKESPLLRIFIDSYSNVDFDIWRKMANKEFLTKRDEMALLVGEPKVDRDLNTFLRVANEYKIFNPQVELDTKFALIAAVTWIGFEIGKIENINIFLDDVMKRLSDTDSVDCRPECRDYIKEIMKCGAIWKADMDSEVQAVWREAVKKLDL